MESTNWSPFARAIHWLSVPLLVLCAIAVWSHEIFDKADPVRAQLMQLHFLAGGTIGAITLVRMCLRALFLPPVQNFPPKIALFARLGHVSFYFLLIALPLCGLVAVSGKGAPINLLGLLEIPPLPVSETVGHAFKEIHEGLASALIALVTIHVAAVVYHTVVLKDQVLASMMGRAQ